MIFFCQNTVHLVLYIAEEVSLPKVFIIFEKSQPGDASKQPLEKMLFWDGG